MEINIPPSIVQPTANLDPSPAPGPILPIIIIIGNIGPGAGEGSRLAVGCTILGGMLISTFFTLYVTPAMYLALAKNTKRIDAIDIELKKQLR